MRVFILLLPLLAGACASAPSDQEQLTEARLSEIEQMLEELLAAQETALEPPLGGGYEIRPPLKVSSPSDLTDEQLAELKATIEKLVIQQQALSGQIQNGYPQNWIPTVFPPDWAVDSQPGWPGIEIIPQLQDPTIEILPSVQIVPPTATPAATLEFVGLDEHGALKLDLKIPNPIGGPTVHHYRLSQDGENWVLRHSGSTEYL